MALQVKWLSPGLLAVVWPDRLTISELEAGITHHDQLLVEWNAPYAVIHESPGVPLLGPTQRRRLADWTELAEHGAHRHCMGSAFVAPSPIVRGIITAVFWFSDPHYPITTVRTHDEAISWALDRLVTPLASNL